MKSAVFRNQNVKMILRLVRSKKRKFFAVLLAVFGLCFVQSFIQDFFVSQSFCSVVGVDDNRQADIRTEDEYKIIDFDVRSLFGIFYVTVEDA